MLAVLHYLATGVALAGQASAPARPVGPLYVYCGIGDHLWPWDREPVDSAATIDAMFEWMARSYGVRRMYWRGGQQEMWAEEYQVGKVSPQTYDWTAWCNYLIQKVRINDVAVRAARRHHMEIFLHTGLFEHGVQPDVGIICPYPFEDRVRIFKGMALGIREADPKARTIVDEGYLHYGFIDRILGEGVDFDILAWHWYSDMGEDLRAVRMPEDESRKGNAAVSFDLSARLRKYGKPVWFNEINRRAGDMGGREAEQAEYLKKALSQLASSDGVSGFFEYELLDELMGADNPESHYGLLRRKQDAEGKWSIVEKKSAFFKYQSVIHSHRHAPKQRKDES